MPTPRRNGPPRSSRPDRPDSERPRGTNRPGGGRPGSNLTRGAGPGAGRDEFRGGPQAGGPRSGGNAGGNAPRPYDGPPRGDRPDRPDRSGPPPGRPGYGPRPDAPSPRGGEPGGYGSGLARGRNLPGGSRFGDDRFDGPRAGGYRPDGPHFDGPRPERSGSFRPESGARRFEGRRPDGPPPQRFDGPRPDGPRPGGPRFDGPAPGRPDRADQGRGGARQGPFRPDGPRGFGPRPEDVGPYGARPQQDRPDRPEGGPPAKKFYRTGPPAPNREAPKTREVTEPVRLNRFLAQSGVASRRKADELIVKGLVAVNDVLVTELGVQVQPGDRVTIRGTQVTRGEHTYILLNKPDDTITTKSDERGRPTVLDLVAIPDEQKAALFPVGRLDRHTTGVLLLTSDGELAHRLTHPSYLVEKLYRVRTERPIKAHEIEKLREGVELDDGPAKPDQAGYVSLPDTHEIGVAMHEGRNRVVRRMIEALGHEVVDLERVSYAGLSAEGIRRGKWRRLTPIEIKRLKRIVKLKG